MNHFDLQSFGYGVLITLVLGFFAFAATVYFSASPVTNNEPMEHKVDPWDLQRLLMKISDQRRPDMPLLHNGVIMYFALILEETSETAIGLFKALEREWGDNLLSPTVPEWQAVLLWRLQHHAEQMHKWSVDMRDDLAVSPDFEVMMTREECKEILDGTTDIMVVNSGFALAAGMPGPAAYTETVTSNMSKADPATGKIKKDPSGKWIKGPDFRKPNLDRVLTEQEEVYDAFNDDADGPDHYMPVQTAL